MKTLIQRDKVIAAAILAAVAISAVPVFAQSPSPAVSPTPVFSPRISPTPRPGKQEKKLDLACMQTAVGKREDAVQSAFDTFYGAIKSALQARKTDLVAAWGMQDKAARLKAIRDAWSKFRNAKSGATVAFRKAKLAAWQQFKNDRIACGSGATGEDAEQDISL